MYNCWRCGYTSDIYCLTCRTDFCFQCAKHHIFLVGKTVRCRKCAYMRDRPIPPELLLDIVCKRYKVDLTAIEEEYRSSTAFRLESTCNRCVACYTNELCLKLEDMVHDPMDGKRMRTSLCCLCVHRMPCNECMNTLCGPAAVVLKRASVPKDVRKIIWRDVKSIYKHE